MSGITPTQNEWSEKPLAPSEAKDTWIFISFRNADQGWVAAFIAEGLYETYGNHLFYQHLDPELGIDVAEYTLAHAESAKVVIAIIGKNWVGPTKDVSGNASSRRIDEESDLVRKELETALTQPNCCVIPVLVKDEDGQSVRLKELRLPESLHKLIRIRHIEVSPDDYKTKLPKIRRAVDEHLIRIGILNRTPVARSPIKRVPLAAAGFGGIASVALATTASCLEILPLGLISLIYGLAAYWDSRIGR